MCVCVCVCVCKTTCIYYSHAGNNNTILYYCVGGIKAIKKLIMPSDDSQKNQNVAFTDFLQP